jgi:hypothetical protein
MARTYTVECTQALTAALPPSGTQAREELIRKTIAAVKGAPKVRCDGLAA